MTDKSRIVVSVLHNFLQLFVASVFVFSSFSVGAQEDGIPFPKSTDGFKPKVTYAIDLTRAWKVVTAAINDNQIPIESASKDANQIITGYRMGPSEGGGFLPGS